MPKVTIAYEIEGDSIVVNLDQKKLSFTGTPQKAECVKNLSAGDYILDAFITGLPGTSYKVTIDGANPAADPIEGRVGNAGKALRSRDFSVVAAAQATGGMAAAVVAGAAVATVAATAATVAVVRRRRRIKKDGEGATGDGGADSAAKRPRRGGRK